MRVSVFFVPTKTIKDEEGEKKLLLASDYTYRLENDGRRIELNGYELQDALAGQVIGKKPERFAPSKRFENIISNTEKNIPQEMKDIAAWGCYRTRWNDEKGKKTKYLISPVDGHWASSKDDTKWVSFEEAAKYARENNCEGLSFLLSREYGITCIDLDKCVKEGTEGELKERAAKISEMCKGSYIERSASGNGLHVFVKGDVLKGGEYRSTVQDEVKGDLEVFDDKRIISVTGDIRSVGKEIKPVGSAATVYLRGELGTRLKSNYVSRVNTNGGGMLKDDELIGWIRRSKVGAKFDELYSGKASGDKSANDAKLAHMLLYFNGGNKEQVFDIMRGSGLNRADKPDSYYRYTIQKMSEEITEFAKRPTQGANAGAGNKRRCGKGKNQPQA